MADVLDHLIEEHRKVEDLLAKLKESEEGQERNDLFAELRHALEVHMAVEETFVYPVMTDVLGEDETADATDEHELARSGLAEAEKRLEEGAFEAAIDILEAGIGHHVEEEESEQFPQLRAKAADRLAAMDPEDLESRVEGSAASGGPSRAELERQAKDADVSGRSSMTKDELAEAVATSD